MIIYNESYKILPHDSPRVKELGLHSGVTIAKDGQTICVLPRIIHDYLISSGFDKWSDDDQERTLEELAASKW